MRISDGILVDGESPIFGYDLVFNSYPNQFPTVLLYLCDTDILNEYADDIRRDAGFATMFADDATDYEGWYDFYIELNDYNDSKVSNSIEFVVCNSQSEDDEQTYSIVMTEEEQREVCAVIDKQCKEMFDHGVNELLEKARKRMTEDHTRILC